jgi:hypothetical protein
MQPISPLHARVHNPAPSPRRRSCVQSQGNKTSWTFRCCSHSSYSEQITWQYTRRHSSFHRNHRHDFVALMISFPPPPPPRHLKPFHTYASHITCNHPRHLTSSPKTRQPAPAPPSAAARQHLQPPPPRPSPSPSRSQTSRAQPQSWSSSTSAKHSSECYSTLRRRRRRQPRSTWLLS